MTAAMVAAAILSGCNGDGSSPTPSPSPTSTPTPSPTPTPGPTNSTLANLVASQTFAVASGRLFKPERGGAVGTTPDSTFDAYGSGITLVYDATANSYAVSDATNPPPFLPANQTTNSAAFRVFANSNGTGNYELTLFNPGSGNTTLALSFVSYGLLQSIQQISSTNSDVFRRPFVYGLQTPVSGLPTTGVVNYTSAIDGYWVRLRSTATFTEGYADLRLSGTATFSVDYATRAVTVSLQLNGTDLRTSNPNLGTISLGTFSGTGTIATGASTFAGTLTGSGFSGTFSGALFGTSATEAGLAFRVDDGNVSSTARQHVAGVVVGKGI